MSQIQIGDIFYESWGYDQTNVDFAQVVSLSATGKTAICRIMGKETVTRETVKPTEAYGLTFRLKVDKWDGEEELKGTYPFVQDESGFIGSHTRFGYFRKFTEPVYETPAGFGH